MKRSIFVAVVIMISNSALANSEEINEWYAGTKYNGTVMTQGLKWKCSGGSCVLRGPYGEGLNMEVCQELSKKVGGLSYYYNKSGMIWSNMKSKALLDQCNMR
ncbi:MAG: hypothetical protein WBP13_12455 [Methylophilaceae bacterium]